MKCNNENPNICTITTFQFSEKQTKAILDMRLQKLTSLEIGKVVDEFNELQTLIKELNETREMKARNRRVEITFLASRSGSPQSIIKEEASGDNS